MKYTKKDIKRILDLTSLSACEKDAIMCEFRSLQISKNDAKLNKTHSNNAIDQKELKAIKTSDGFFGCITNHHKSDSFTSVFSSPLTSIESGIRDFIKSASSF